ncbi:MAG: hypothetical protein PHF24_07895 [Syntrophomonas sp.]|nr:hypothetical protein [Syntrophomonas sp.]
MKDRKVADTDNDCTQVRYLKQWVQQQSKKRDYSPQRNPVIERKSIDPEYKQKPCQYHTSS